MQINWTSIVFGIVLFLIGLSIPSPFSCEEPIVTSPIVKPDSSTTTIVAPQDSLTGQASSTPFWTSTKPKPGKKHFVLDTSIVLETKDSSNGTHFSFRSTVHLYADQDTFIAQPVHEWNIMPKPAEIQKVEIKVPVPYEVQVSIPRPIYESPIVTIPIGIGLGLLLSLLINK